MKKLFFTLVALMVSMFALNLNAQTIYMMGSGEGLSWEAFPGKAINPGSDGSYSVTIENLTGFKVSTKQATNWDDFNSEAFGYSGTFGDAVYSSAGQTVSLEAWGENQDMPATGSYTITINASRTSMTVKANFAKPTAAPDVYIRGEMNGWGSNASYKFTNKSWDGSKGEWTWSGTLNSGVQFKIADANWGAVNYTTNSTSTQATGQPVNLVYNGSNMAMGATFTGTITLNISNYTGHQATATFTVGGGEETPTYPANLYVIGNVNNLGWDPTNGFKMNTTSEGVYSVQVRIGGEMGTSYGYFSFAEQLSTSSSDWSGLGTRYGATSGDFEPSFTSANTITFGENSFKVEEGDYNMTVNLKEMTLTITAGNGGGGDTPVNPNPDTTLPVTLYMMGDVNSYSWATDKGIAANGNAGVYNFDNVTVDDSYQGNGYINLGTVLGADWDAVNEGNRYGAETGDTPLSDGQTATVKPYYAGVDASGCQSWMVPAGKYNFVVDLNSWTISATAIGGGDTPVDPTPDPTLPETVYIIGNVVPTNWDEPVQGIAANGNNGVYSWSSVTVSDANAGSGYFSFATIVDGGWDDVVNTGNRYGSTSGDYPIAAGETASVNLYAAGVDASAASSWMITAGTYDFVLDLNNMSLTVKSVGGGGDTPVDPTPDPSLPATVYIIGNVVPTNWDAPVQGIAANGTNGVYSWSSVAVSDANAGSGYFSFATIVGGGWDDVVNTGNRYGSTSGDYPIAAGETASVNLYAAGVDASAASSWMITAGTYDFVLDLNKMELKVLKPGSSSVENIETVDGEAEYYNLQGVKVQNPERGIFIKVVNGKSVKVVK